MSKKVVVIGGGAAGFFAALSVKQHHPSARVEVLEKTTKLLSKVKVSGGGRCNVTNVCEHVSELIQYYPRGERFLKKSFRQFGTLDTRNWFENRGVKLKVERDGRVFPVSNNSQTVIDCLLSSAQKMGVVVSKQRAVEMIEKLDSGFQVSTNAGILSCDIVVVTSGGYAKSKAYDWVRELGVQVIEPVPSLFTFNIPDNELHEFKGLSVPQAAVKIQSTKLITSGPALVTHWGLSGPAVLKLSAWGARLLNEMDYNFKVQVNWVNRTESAIRNYFEEEHDFSTNRKVSSGGPFELPSRLWGFLIKRSDINTSKTWRDLSKKEFNKMVNVLCNDEYEVSGKTTFKEEFVTSGGVSLADIDPQTMQHKSIDNLYFAGEVLDIDGLTGGFNFQAAWTTGYIAGKLN